MSRKIDLALIPAFPTLQYEMEAWRKGHLVVAGLDEAGRGALAGPLCAAAVVLPVDRSDLEEKLFGVRDSKQMSILEREQWSRKVMEVASDFAIAWVEPDEIDQLGMARAGKLVFERAIADLKKRPNFLLLDYFKLPQISILQTCLVKGDQRSLSIACASVIAKQARDQKMIALAADYPLYDFGRNKGYGTAEHLQAIDAYGLCPIHRRTFSEHLLQGRLFDL